MTICQVVAVGCTVGLFMLSTGQTETAQLSPPQRFAPVKRHTLKQLRDQYIVKQQADYSCAAAALATLLTYYFEDPVTERALLVLLKARLSQAEQRAKERRGFSLLDLKRVAEMKGYRAAGFQLTYDQLRYLTMPVLIFVKPQGYEHFAVLRGVDRGRVFLADPTRGNLRMSRGRFLREWGGIVFVLEPAEGRPTARTDRERQAWGRRRPLSLPKTRYVQPELLTVSHILDMGVFLNVSGIRAQQR